MKLLQLFLLLPLLLFACKSRKYVQCTVSYQQVAKEKLGSAVQFSVNTNKTYCIASYITTTNNRSNTSFLSYIVFNIASNRILCEKHQLRNRTINWHSNNEIAVTNAIGTAQKGHSNKQVIYLDVRSHCNSQHKSIHQP